MKNSTQEAAPTFESVWALLQENAIQMKENERVLNEKFAETDRQMQETDRRMQTMQKAMGSWANNHGSFAEEYFFNSFEKGKQNFFGEKFDEIEKNVKGFGEGFNDEYDILLINGRSIGIIEVKFKAHEEHIPKILRKAKTFRVNFSKYANHQVYLGFASMSFHPEVENLCIKEGIAIIKQVGDTAVINDGHLKVF